MLQVILGSFGVFPIFNNLISRKQQVLERKLYLNLYVMQFYVVIICHLVMTSRASKPLGFFLPLQMVFSYYLLVPVEIILHDVYFLYSCYQLHNSFVCPSNVPMCRPYINRAIWNSDFAKETVVYFLRRYRYFDKIIVHFLLTHRLSVMCW